MKHDRHIRACEHSSQPVDLLIHSLPVRRPACANRTASRAKAKDVMVHKGKPSSHKNAARLPAVATTMDGAHKLKARLYRPGNQLILHISRLLDIDLDS